MHSQNAQRWYQVESEQLGRSLTLQAARLLAAPMAKEEKELVANYVSVVNKGMYVKGAVLFDASGVRFAQQEGRLSVVEIMKQTDVEPLVFVEDIVFDNAIIGYIKLVLDKQAITLHHRQFNKNQLSQSILMIALTIITVALGTRLFYKTRKSYRSTENENSLI